MRFHLIVKILIVISICSCNNSDTKESTEAATAADTATKKTEFQYLTTDYPERVFAFKKMPDSTPEEQVIKYERFSVLFIEYVGINKNQPLYSMPDQENNTEAYNVLRDEMVSLKVKLKKSMPLLTQYQESRLDAADAQMNVYLPQVYK